MAYVKPTLSEQIAQMKTAFQVYLGTTEASLQFSYLNTIGISTAGAINGIYGYADYIAAQTFIDTADTENLERWAAIWGIIRTPAIKAEGAEVAFVGSNGAFIAEGTELKRSDDARFITTADGTVGVSGTIDLPVEAKIAGDLGNTEATIEFTLVSPPIGITSKATVGGLGILGGRDDGTDDELRLDIYDRIQTPPQGGAQDDYTTWALEVDNVTRAWTYTPDTTPATPIGQVFVLFMMDTKYVDGVPQQVDIDEVTAYINEKRPVTAQFTVSAPAIQEVAFDIELVPDTPDTRATVTSELDTFFFREATPGGTLRLSRISEAISLAVGEDYHYLNTPSADVTSPDYTLSTLGTITWS
jgi:uncharacterized phage protein gp47/JayE